MKLLAANNAESTLSALLADDATPVSVAVGDGSKFPSPGSGEAFRLTIYTNTPADGEIVECTTRVDDTLTVVRGDDMAAGDLDKRTSVEWPAGSKVGAFGTAEMYARIWGEVEGNMQKARLLSFFGV